MKRILCCIALLFAVSSLIAQTTTITASNISDVGGNLTTGTWCVQPVQPFVRGGGGNVVPTQVCYPVTSGALPAGVVLADTSMTNPAHVCYRVTVRNQYQEPILQQACFQPSGATYSYDDFVEASPPYINTSFTVPEFSYNGALLPNAVAITGSGVNYSNGILTIPGNYDAQGAAAAAQSNAEANAAATFMPLAGGAITGATAMPNAAPSGQASLLFGPFAGDPADIYVNKLANQYGFNAYDNTASLTPNYELYDGEMYNVSGALTGTRAVYRAHIDPSNTSPTALQLVGFAAGAHGINAVGFADLANGNNSIGYYGQRSGEYGNYWVEGIAQHGVASMTYVSGGTFSGTGSCQVQVPGSGANFIGAMSVTGGTPGGIGVMIPGNNFTAAPTAASVGNWQTGTLAGTANCSGAITVTSTLTPLSSSGGTIGTYILHYSTGNVFDILQGQSTMTNDVILINTGVAGGTFTGNFLEFQQNGTPVFKVGATGAVTATSISGPATAPSGACSIAGQWVFSQDGHATFCSGSTWITKI